MLHRFHDGSVLRTMKAKDLVKIPIWKGNRTLDKAHAARIREAVPRVALLDSGYRIVKYNETNAAGMPVLQSYLIDGQHRAEVLREHFLGSLCEPDFEVVVSEKLVASESEAIDYFNAINNVKPQQWRTDPAILVNKYITELERTFNTKKPGFIRTSTNRPYLGADKLREALKAVTADLPQETTQIQAFCQRALMKNKEMLEHASLLCLANTKDSKFYERAAEVGFMLAVDSKLPWVRELLRHHP